MNTFKLFMGLASAVGACFALQTSARIRRKVLILGALAFLQAAAFASSARADKLVLVAGTKEEPLVQPFGTDFHESGIVFVEMAKGERLRRIDSNGKLTTLAGTLGEKGDAGDGKRVAEVRFNGMHSLAVGPEGNVYLADTWNNRVRVFDPKTGLVQAFAGTGVKGFAGDGGPAKDARFGGCFCVSFDPAKKNGFITDLDNKRIRKVNMSTGIVTTVAGNGRGGVPKDGAAAVDQPLVDPRAHAVDAKGNLYILERSGHALRVVDADGRIRTVAGTGKAGMGTGPALQAALNGPKHLCIDTDGSVLIADTENHRIVRYVPDKDVIEAVAGTGKKGAAGAGGDPLKAELNQPHGVNVHPKTREIYISDASSGRILKITRE
jgi:DNA-binding beta-propeller fold protein YncE